MTKLVPTYVREGGEVLAFFDSRVIARDPIFAQAEKSALEYLEGLTKQRGDKDKEDKKKVATHIVTPNGMKGEILGRTDGLWGEKELTVRFENGRIAKLQAHGGNDDDIEYTTEKPEVPEDKVDELQEVLDEDYAHDKSSLAKRIVQLDELVVAASTHVANSSEVDINRINQVVLAANHEKGEVGEALAYLEQADAEAFAPPAFTSHVVEQAQLGRSSSDGTTNWLDRVAQDMIDETADQNFDKILSEDPAQLVAGLETGTIAEQGSTAEISRDYITAKTAAYTGAEVESYRELFVAATEQARRVELADRKETVAKQVTAKEEETADILDESLFM